MPIYEIIGNLSVWQVIIFALGLFMLCVAAVFFRGLRIINEREQEAFDPSWMDAAAYYETEVDRHD